MEEPCLADTASLFPDHASLLPLSRQLVQNLRRAIRGGRGAHGRRAGGPAGCAALRRNRRALRARRREARAVSHWRPGHRRVSPLAVGPLRAPSAHAPVPLRVRGHRRLAAPAQRPRRPPAAISRAACERRSDRDRRRPTVGARTDRAGPRRSRRPGRARRSRLSVRHRVRSPGARIVPIAIDEHGLDATQAPAARACFVTPAHQYPLGGTLPSEQRRALLA